MAKKTVHIISHSHWDREWYQSFERHRMLLVELFDDLFYLFEHDDSFNSFHLDGQTILIDDYLEIKPENKEKMQKYIDQGKLKIGPFYILQDDYLISSEANARNTLIGIQESLKWNNYVPLGYFPDTFGNMGQAPQIMKGFGLDTVAFGRGVKSTGFNNEVSDEIYATEHSEMWWEGSDGTSVFSILFANWYSNGNEIPTDKDAAKLFWDEKLADAERYASTNQLLMMNGVDHQPVQMDVTKAIKTANELYPNYDFIHSNFEDYIAAVMAEIPKDLGSVKGELTSQETDGWYTLANTASSRMYLKQANAKSQILLEDVVEPLATINSVHGGEYPQEAIRYAWKLLLQNHPHDSICGCSVDEVHREMETRYEKVEEITTYLQEETLRQLSKKLDTRDLSKHNFTVFNTYAFKRDITLDVELEWERMPFTEGHPQDLYEELLKKEIPNFKLIDELGKDIAFDYLGDEVRFDYDLPKDQFRIPYMAKFINLRVYLKDISGYSWESLQIIETQEEPNNHSSENISLENDFIKVDFLEKGQINILNKENNQQIENFFYYEDTGDIGNEYIYRQSRDEQSIFSTDFDADYQIVHESENSKTIEMVQTISIPKSAESLLDQEQARVIDMRFRKSKRSRDLVDLQIRTQFTVEKDNPQLKIKTNFDNQAKDHRIRAIFNPNIKSDHHYAESVYEVIRRPNSVSNVWENPENPQRMQAFMSMEDEKNGMILATKGLPEYEVLDQTKIALTLLRAVREMGDWGYFPTPEAQCLGKQEFEYVISFYDDGNRFNRYHQAKAFTMIDSYVQNQVHQGSLKSTDQFLNIETKQAMVTALKMSEDLKDPVLRLYNMGDKKETVMLDNTLIVETNMLEEEIEQDNCNDLAAFEIKTYRIKERKDG